MHNHSPDRTSNTTDISAMTHQFGIPYPLRMNHELLACYGQSPEIALQQPPWLWDLVWTAARALTGLLPCRRQTTADAEVYHVETFSYVSCRAEPEFIRCYVSLSCDPEGNPHLTFCLAPPV